MSKAETYESKTTSLIMPVLERMNFELVDVEYVKEGSTYYLRAYIDKEGGITVNDCEAVAREMNVMLDAWERKWKSEPTVRLTGVKNFMES